MRQGSVKRPLQAGLACKASFSASATAVITSWDVANLPIMRPFENVMSGNFCSCAHEVGFVPQVAGLGRVHRVS